MDRRKSLGLLGTGAFFIANSSFSSIDSTNKIGTPQENFKVAFEKRWRGLRQHTFEVCDSMPGDQFDFKPTDDLMSFGNLFCHVGWSLDIYKEVLDGTKKVDKLESNDKSLVSNYLQSRFDGFEEAMASVSEERLYMVDHHFIKTEPWKNFSIYDVLMLSYNHAVHHKDRQQPTFV